MKRSVFHIWLLLSAFYYFRRDKGYNRAELNAGTEENHAVLSGKPNDVCVFLASLNQVFAKISEELIQGLLKEQMS